MLHTNFMDVAITVAPFATRIRKSFSYPVQSKRRWNCWHLRKEKRIDSVRELGLKVVVCWEHDFDALLKTNPEAKAFVDQLDLVDRLDPRDSLMGGRTNGCTLYKKATKGMMIHYVDFTSLYPFVNKTCQYPVGHP